MFYEKRGATRLTRVYMTHNDHTLHESIHTKSVSVGIQVGIFGCWSIWLPVGSPVKQACPASYQIEETEKPPKIRDDGNERLICIHDWVSTGSAKY